MTAARVNGTPYFMKVVALTSCPSLRKIPMPAMFADAPIGSGFRRASRRRAARST